GDLPEWMLLHFQVDRESGWRSPQVLAEDLTGRLQHLSATVALSNVTPERKAVLAELSRSVRADALIAQAAERRNRPALEDITVLAGNYTSNTQPLSPSVANSANAMPQNQAALLNQSQA